MSQQVVRTEKKGSIAVVSIDNPPVNSLSLAVFQQLGEALEAAVADSSVTGIVLTGAGKNFSAGFDLTTVETFAGPEQLREGNPKIYRMFEAMEDSPKPIVAALKGSVLGGGLEVALACHYRIADETASLGLPEVQVGLLPGGGGTQRLPRVVGVQEGLTMICQGQPIKVEHAQKIGLVDKLVSSDSLLDQAVAARQPRNPAGTKHTPRRANGKTSFEFHDGGRHLHVRAKDGGGQGGKDGRAHEGPRVRRSRRQGRI
ncbi:MAG: enoyl-CoA hydratase/isomerase family protein [Planctomycetota bacterium]